MNEIEQADRSGMRLVTLIAIAIVAYAVSTVIHEAGGHSLVATALGVRVTSISSLNMDYDVSGVSAAHRKVISAAGTVANILTALLALAILRRRPESPNLRFFLWLFLSVSLLSASGYPGYSAIGGTGDWANVIDGLSPPIVWRAILLSVSVALYWISLQISARELVRLIGSPSRDVSRRLVIPAYITGGLLFCASAAFNPAGPRLILIPAIAGSFGSMVGIVISLAWFKSEEKADLPIERSIPWILAAMVVAVLYIGVLGPGIKL